MSNVRRCMPRLDTSHLRSPKLWLLVGFVLVAAFALFLLITRPTSLRMTKLDSQGFATYGSTQEGFIDTRTGTLEIEINGTVFKGIAVFTPPDPTKSPNWRGARATLKSSAENTLDCSFGIRDDDYGWGDCRGEDSVRYRADIGYTIKM